MECSIGLNRRSVHSVKFRIRTVMAKRSSSHSHKIWLASSVVADRAPDGQQDGSTTRRRARLDVAASAAAVRSEAEDERRSREHSAAAALNAQRAAPKG